MPETSTTAGSRRRLRNVRVPIAVRRLIPSLALLLVGCGYMIGGAYPPEVRTVAVPIFESDSNRRGIELQLTEAVQHQIKTRTPFLIAKQPYADTILTGRIVSADKRMLTISPLDLPRELQLDLAIHVTWEDARTGRILQERNLPLDPDTVHLVAQAEFAPELGQSLATASQEAVDRLAIRIVDMMESPW